MGIETTDFISLLTNSGNGIQMFLLEGGKVMLTTTLEKRSKLNSYSTACLLRVGQSSTEAHDIMATSVLEFILKISGRSDLYTTHVFQGRLGWIQSQTTAFYEFIWAFRDRRHKDCLSVAQDVLFQRLLPGTMGVPLPRMRDCIKRMIAILRHGMLALKDRWPGHPSILPRVFGPSQYLMRPLAQLTKPKPKLKPMVTLKPLPADATSKLTPPETQSDAEEWQHMQTIAGGDVRRVVGTSVIPINNFMNWFQAILANMNPVAQQKALVASRKAASSVFTDAGDDKRS